MLGVVFCGKVEIIPGYQGQKYSGKSVMIIMIVANICF